MASEKLYRNTLELFLLNEIFMAFRFFFFHRNSSFFRGKREMAVNTEYVKSVQGLLKILEFVSISEKSNLFW